MCALSLPSFFAAVPFLMRRCALSSKKRFATIRDNALLLACLFFKENVRRVQRKISVRRNTPSFDIVTPKVLLNEVFTICWMILNLLDSVLYFSFAVFNLVVFRYDTFFSRHPECSIKETTERLSRIFVFPSWELFFVP